MNKIQNLRYGIQGKTYIKHHALLELLLKFFHTCYIFI
ncbi:hypothetical protein A21D_00086 [Virgibacillus dokdonensis]|uniref:Uncharacterized protein n=1 Tax=Virgibacillus dokdonensis TaxID=302167 RepID=A0A2K9ITV2_9BACI|nr:hypothetical protein A21D_00086 [Virgibacillus dokdonensis]